MSSSLRPSPRAKAQQEVYRVLKENEGGIRTSKIQALVKDSPTKRHIRRILNKMVARGLAEKVVDPNDNRRTVYHTTDKLRSTPHYTANDVNHYFSAGYSTIHHQQGGEKHAFPVHRLVAVAEYGIEAVEGKQIHHKNKHPSDNSPGNLVPLSASLHKKADLVASVKMTTEDGEFEQLLELADAADV